MPILAWASILTFISHGRISPLKSCEISVVVREVFGGARGGARWISAPRGSSDRPRQRRLEFLWTHTRAANGWGGLSQSPIVGLLSGIGDPQAAIDVPLPAVNSLFAEVRRGARSITDAFAVIRERVRQDPLTPWDTRRTAAMANEMSDREPVGGWQLAQLLRAAVQAQAQEPGLRLPDRTEADVDVSYVWCASAVLRVLPDPLAYGDAVAVAETIRARCEREPRLTSFLRKAAHAEMRLRHVVTGYGTDIGYWNDPFEWRHAAELAPDPRPELPDARRELACAEELRIRVRDLLSPRDRAYSNLWALFAEKYLHPGPFRDRNWATELVLEALELLGTDDPVGAVIAAQAVVALAGELPMPAEQLLAASFSELFRQVNSSRIAQLWEAQVRLLHAAQADAELATRARQVAESDIFERLDNPRDRTAFLSALLHGLDGSGIDCAAAISSANDPAALSRLLKRGLSDEQRYWAELHVAVHTKRLAVADAIMTTRLIRVEASRRTMANAHFHAR